MKHTQTDTVRHQSKRHRVRLATAIVAIAAGGLSAASPANAESPVCSEAFWNGDNAGAEISSFAVIFDRYTNPGAGFHEDGDPLVAGICNPTWTD